MQRCFKVANTIILWSMLVIMFVCFFGFHLVGIIATKMNDGGIMAAMGYLARPYKYGYDDGLMYSMGGLIHPIIFVVLAIISSLATKYFMSGSWHDIVGEENCLYYLTFCFAFFSFLLTFCCMLARYKAWHYR